MLLTPNHMNIIYSHIMHYNTAEESGVNAWYCIFRL